MEDDIWQGCLQCVGKALLHQKPIVGGTLGNHIQESWNDVRV